jgi:hypothetical protein
MLSYSDATNTPHEIFITPGRYHEALHLLERQDWKALSECPRWSDCPPLPPRDPDAMTYATKDLDGKSEGVRTIYLPQGTAERATLLFVNEDWAALEREFEEYSKSCPLVRC